MNSTEWITKSFPRTMQEAFPNDRAEYACALERPRRRARFPWKWIANVLLIAYVLLPLARHLLG